MNIISKINEELYIIIPIICIGFWAIINLIRANFNLAYPQDFNIFYRSGKQIFIDPKNLYQVRGYFYLPSFAIFFSLTLSLIPLYLAHYIWYVIIYILGILSIREFNEILILMKVKEKVHRFMFLIIISNGYFVYYIFRFKQTKFLVLLILLYILKREFQIKNNKIETNLKYYLINYGLFVFAISMAPYFIFLLLIYIFHDIHFNDLFKKKNLKIYCIAIIMFLSQNFLFIIFPVLIFEFLNAYGFIRIHGIQLFYLREWVSLSQIQLMFATIILTIILIVISFILIVNNQLTIEKKFAYFSITYLFTGIFSYQIFILLILFSFILFLFVPCLNQNVKGIEFIRCNKILLLGLLIILIISFMPPTFALYVVFPILSEYPFYILVNLRWVFLLCILMITLFRMCSINYKS